MRRCCARRATIRSNPTKINELCSISRTAPAPRCGRRSFLRANQARALPFGGGTSIVRGTEWWKGAVSSERWMILWNGGAAAFSGHVDHALDVKGRLIVPARFREILGSRFVLSIALGDPCLVLLTQDVYAARCRQLQASPNKDARFWKFYREINRLTESRAECDNQGRLLIPPDLRKYAGIVRDVVRSVTACASRSGRRRSSRPSMEQRRRRGVRRGAGVLLNAPAHVSVLLHESIDALEVRPGGVYVDATFGAGGQLGDRRARRTRLGLRRRPVGRGAGRPRRFGHARASELRGNRERTRRARGRARRRLRSSTWRLVDAVRSRRAGLFIQADGPLDMRMNPEAGRSAYALLSELDEREMADSDLRYGEERASRRIARAIVAARDRGELPARTARIRGARRARGRRARPLERSTRPRDFQALRIAVNDELDALRRGSTPRPTAPGPEAASRRSASTASKTA